MGENDVTLVLRGDARLCRVQSCLLLLQSHAVQTAQSAAHAPQSHPLLPGLRAPLSLCVPVGRLLSGTRSSHMIVLVRRTLYVYVCREHRI